METREISGTQTDYATSPPATAAVVPVAAGFPPRPPSLPCANCGTILTGPFCAQCGQHIADFHRSVRRLVGDFAATVFNWDSKLVRTLGPLFKQPGFLTTEFLLGRRVRYVQPLKLFLFTSAVCLTLLHFGSGGSPTRAQARHAAKAAKKSHASPSATPANGDNAAKLSASAPPKADGDDDDDDNASPTPDKSTPTPGFVSPPAAIVPSPSPSFLDGLHVKGLPNASPGASEMPLDADAIKATVRAALKSKIGAEKADAATEWGEKMTEAAEAKAEAAGGWDKSVQQITENVRQRLSWVALAMLPIFAFMLHALYRGEDRFYFAHLIFSLHYHTFLLLFWVAYTRVSEVFGNTWLHLLVTMLLLTPPAYLFFALRRVYGGGVGRTGVKTLVLGGAHLLAIGIGLAAIGASAVFTWAR